MHIYTYIYIHMTHGLRVPPFCHPALLCNHSDIEWETGVYIHFKSIRFYVYQAFVSEHNTERFQVSTHGGEVGLRHYRSTVPPQASRLMEDNNNGFWWAFVFTLLPIWPNCSLCHWHSGILPNQLCFIFRIWDTQQYKHMHCMNTH